VVLQCTGTHKLQCAASQTQSAPRLAPKREPCVCTDGVWQKVLARSARDGFAAGCNFGSRRAAYAGLLLRLMQAGTAHWR